MALIQGFLEYDTALLDGEKKTHSKAGCDAECAAGAKDGECSKSQCNKSQMREKMRKNIMRKKLTNYTGIFTEPQAASGTVMK